MSTVQSVQTVRAQLLDALRAPSPLLMPAYSLVHLDRQLFDSLYGRSLLQGCIVAMGTECGTIFTWPSEALDVVVLANQIYLAPHKAAGQWIVFAECNDACEAISNRLTK